MTPSPRTLLGAAVLAALLPSCKAKPRTGSEGTNAPASSSAALGARAKTAPSARVTADAAAPHAIAGCRAIQVTGAVASGDRPLRVGGWVDGQSWVTLPKDAKVVVKYPSSARELALSGPGRARLCAGGEEQVVLSQGTLRTTAGAGARPGVQVLVFTPLGIIHYGDADLEARVGERSVNMQVFAGDAWVEPLFGATRQGPEHVLPKGKSALKLAAAPSAERAITACREASQSAATAAEAVLTNAPAGVSLGQRAANQLKARQTARALCGSARAVLGNTRDPASAQKLEIGINEADALWQKVPIGPAGPAKP